MTEVANQTEHDPICHMDIDIKDAVGSSTFEGKTYYFCSPGCKLDFDADPAAALKAEAEYDHSQPVNHMMMIEDEPAPSSEKKPWWRFGR